MTNRWLACCFAAVAACVFSEAASVPGGLLDLSNGGYSKDVLRLSELLKHGDPAQWEEVNLSGNHIDEVDDNSFAGFENLQRLSLSSNSLGTVEDHWFRGTKLTTLDLSKNALVAIRSDAFRDLTDLRQLNLSNNLLRPFKANTFQHTPKLTKLTMDNNPRVLDMFRNVTIPSLEELHLKSCRISNITTLHLENLPNLKTVDLQGNVVVSLHDGAFSSNTKLQEVDLRNNIMDQLRGSMLSNAFSANSKVVLHIDHIDDVCIDCKLHSCSTDRDLQEFLCQDPKSSTFRSTYEWRDQGKNITVTLKAYAHTTS